VSNCADELCSEVVVRLLPKAVTSPSRIDLSYSQVIFILKNTIPFTRERKEKIAEKGQ
jgi:hypothetical protein